MKNIKSYKEIFTKKGIRKPENWKIRIRSR